MKGTRKKILCQSTITWSLKKERQRTGGERQKVGDRES